MQSFSPVKNSDKYVRYYVDLNHHKMFTNHYFIKKCKSLKRRYVIMTSTKIETNCFFFHFHKYNYKSANLFFFLL